MRIRVQDPKNVHVAPDPDARVNTKEEKLHQQVFYKIFLNDIKNS